MRKMTAKQEAMANRLTRRQVARLLGVQVAQVAGLDGWQLHPVQRADRRWIYEGPEVTAVLTDTVSRGKVVAHAFKLFADGDKSLVQVVIATLQPAQRIVELRAYFDAIEGSMTLTKDQVERLQRVFGNNCIDDARALVKAIDARFEAEYARGYSSGKEPKKPSGGSN